MYVMLCKLGVPEVSCLSCEGLCCVANASATKAATGGCVCVSLNHIVIGIVFQISTSRILMISYHWLSFSSDLMTTTVVMSRRNHLGRQGGSAGEATYMWDGRTCAQGPADSLIAGWKNQVNRAVEYLSTRDNRDLLLILGMISRQRHGGWSTE
jgi:hypothetical protein